MQVSVGGNYGLSGKSKGRRGHILILLIRTMKLSGSRASCIIIRIF